MAFTMDRIGPKWTYNGPVDLQVTGGPTLK